MKKINIISLYIFFISIFLFIALPTSHAAPSPSEVGEKAAGSSTKNDPAIMNLEVNCGKYEVENRKEECQSAYRSQISENIGRVAAVSDVAKSNEDKKSVSTKNAKCDQAPSEGACKLTYDKKIIKEAQAQGKNEANNESNKEKDSCKLYFGGKKAKNACIKEFQKTRNTIYANKAKSCGDTKTYFDFSAICKGTDSGDGGEKNPIYAMILGITNILAVGVSIAVAGGIIYGGIMYASAQDNAGQTQKAIGIIANSIIGLILFFLLFAILNFIVPGGLITG